MAEGGGNAEGALATTGACWGRRVREPPPDAAAPRPQALRL